MPVNEKFMISLQGKSFVTYEGLLDLAHQKNLQSISVELVQVPTKENNMTAICKATAFTEKGTFTDFGDASPQSVNSKITPHIIRMASTRAKARALRDLTNVGMTAIEELVLDELTKEDNLEQGGNISIDHSIEERPTGRQMETLEKLADSLNVEIDFSSLDKKSAGTLISKMLNEKYKKH